MSIRLCPSCRRIFPPGVAACPDHGLRLVDDPVLGQNLTGYQVVTWVGDGLYTAIRGPEMASEEAQVLVRILPPQVAPSNTTPERRAGPAGEPTLRRVLAALRAASDATEGIAVSPQEGGVLPGGRFYYLINWPREARREPLRSRLARAPRALPEALEVAVAICRAVEVAHAAQFYPGDLHAESVLLEQGPEARGARAYLLDVGLDLGGDSMTVTDASAALGSHDPRREVYAIGALLYHLATGVPLDHATAFAGPGADLPSEFQAVTLRALAARPADRQPTVAALRKDLLMLLRDTRPRRRPGQGRRSQLVLSLLIAGVLVVALVASALLLYLPVPSPTGPAASVPSRVVAPSNEAPPKSPEATTTATLEGGARLVPLPLRALALDTLGEAQRSIDPAARWYAADIIGHSHDPRLRLQAEELLADVEPRVAARAAWALGRLGDRAAVVALGQATGDLQIAPEVGVSLLQLVDRRGLDLLRGVLRAPEGRGEVKSRREESRLEAALWLGEHGEPEAWRALRRFLLQTQDESPLQHLTILGRLCQGRDQAACQQLRDRVRDGLTGQGRVLVGAGLMRAGDLQGVNILREAAKDPALQLLALRQLAEGALDAAEERFLLAVLEGGPGSPEARARAVEALGVSGAAAAVPSLGKALADKDPQVSRAAASALLRLSALEPDLLSQRALTWALAGAADSRVQIRAAAATILGHGPVVLTAPLLARALTDRDVNVRVAAARSLGQLGAGAALPALHQGLADRDGPVRVMTMRSLGSTNDPAAQALLRDHLSRGTLLEQVTAAGVLLSRGDTSHRFVLQQALQSPDVPTRRQALEEARHDPDKAQRVALLGQALADAADEVQLVAAVALACDGDRRGVEALKRQTSLLLPQRLVARDALLRLGEQTPSLDIMATLGAAGEGQRAAAMAVAPQLQTETAMALLLRGLRDAAVTVRLAAVTALQELGEAGLPARSQQQLLLLVSSDPDLAVQARALGQLARLYAQPAR